MSLFSGLFLVTVSKNSDNFNKIDKEFFEKLKGKLTRVDTGKVVVYNYPISSKNEFDFILNKLMRLDVEPNIFEK